MSNKWIEALMQAQANAVSQYGEQGINLSPAQNQLQAAVQNQSNTGLCGMAPFPVEPGASYTTESGQQFVNASDRTIEFASPADARPAVLARLTAQQEQIGRLMCRIEQIERENADLRIARDYWVDKLANIDADTPFATRAEAELVERAMPARALKFSR